MGEHFNCSKDFLQLYLILMNNLFIIIVIILGVAWGASFFLGVVKKSFKNSPSSSIQSEQLQTQQKKMAQDTEDQRKRLMENYKQRIEDSQR